MWKNSLSCWNELGSTAMYETEDNTVWSAVKIYSKGHAEMWVDYFIFHSLTAREGPITFLRM